MTMECYAEEITFFFCSKCMLSFASNKPSPHEAIVEAGNSGWKFYGASGTSPVCPKCDAKKAQ